MLLDDGKTERVILANKASIEASQEAITEYRVLGPTINGCSWIELCPRTSRKHQVLQAFAFFPLCTSLFKFMHKILREKYPVWFMVSSLVFIWFLYFRMLHFYPWAFESNFHFIFGFQKVIFLPLNLKGSFHLVLKFQF